MQRRQVWPGQAFLDPGDGRAPINHYLLTAGQLFALFVVVVAAAEATIGLAIVLLIYRNWRGIDAENVSIMKW